MSKIIILIASSMFFYRCTSFNSKKEMDDHCKRKQEWLRQAFCDIKDGRQGYISYVDKGILDIIYKDCENGKTLLHFAVSYSNVDAFNRLIENLSNKLNNDNNDTYIYKRKLSDWINIEDDEGKTPLDYASKNNHFSTFYNSGPRSFIYKKLKGFGAKAGSNIAYNLKLQPEKFYFLSLMNELRFCFHNNDIEKGENLIKYFRYFSPKILLYIVEGWTRKQPLLNNCSLPKCLYSHIASYINLFDIKTELGNVILDELLYFGDKMGKLHSLLQKAGARPSDLYIQNNLFDNQTKLLTYKQHLDFIDKFYKQDGNDISLAVNFIKQIMKLGDLKTLGLFLSHSKINLKGDLGEDLLHFAVSHLLSPVSAKILYFHGAYCESIIKDQVKCFKDSYRPEY